MVEAGWQREDHWRKSEMEGRERKAEGVFNKRWGIKDDEMIKKMERWRKQWRWREGGLYRLAPESRPKRTKIGDIPLGGSCIPFYCLKIQNGRMHLSRLPSSQTRSFISKRLEK